MKTSRIRLSKPSKTPKQAAQETQVWIMSAAQLQRKPGESPEEHIARITALLDAAAEAMAIAAMEHRRRLEEQKRRAKMKL